MKYNHLVYDELYSEQFMINSLRSELSLLSRYYTALLQNHCWCIEHFIDVVVNKMFVLLNPLNKTRP